MSSKKYRNKVCAYCGKTSLVPEHVIAKSFFSKESMQKHDAIIVPACQKCNVEKSRVEHDFRAFYAFGDDNKQSREVLESVLRGIQKTNNQKLWNLVVQNFDDDYYYSPTGKLDKRRILKVPEQLIIDWTTYVSRGLFFYKFGRPLGENDAAYMLVESYSVEQFGWIFSLVSEVEERFLGEFTIVSGRSIIPEENLYLLYWEFKFMRIGMVIVSRDKQDHYDNELSRIGWRRIFPSIESLI